VYVITLATGIVVGTSSQDIMAEITANHVYISVTWIDDLDDALGMVDYVEE